MSTSKIGVLQTMVDPVDYQTALPSVNNLAVTTTPVTTYGVLDSNNYASGSLVQLPQRGYKSLSVQVPYKAGGAVTVPTMTVSFIADGTAAQSDNGGLTIEPKVEDQFSIGRVYASMTKVYSSTQSTTRAALSGTIGCGALTDVRGVDISKQATLASASLTKKDGRTGISMGEGIVGTLGPDIRSEFGPIDMRKACMEQDGGYEFLTSWSGTEPHTLSDQIAGVGAIQEPGVGPLGADQAVTYEFRVRKGSATGNSQLVVHDMYVARSNDINSGTPFEWVGTLLVSGYSVGVDDLTYPITHTARPWAQARTLFNSASDHSGFGDPTSVEEMTYVGSMVFYNDANAASSVAVSARVHGLYAQGQTGPALVWTWREVGADQEITIKGKILVEALAGADIAPYVRASQPKYLNSNILAYADMLYNGDSQVFKRFYTGREYNRVLDDLPNMVSTVAVAHRDGSPDLQEAGQAAGILSDLGSIGGSLIGGLTGNPRKGAQLGGLLGGVGDSIFGNASGMLGSSAGMLGSNYRV